MVALLGGFGVLPGTDRQQAAYVGAAAAVGEPSPQAALAAQAQARIARVDAEHRAATAQAARKEAQGVLPSDSGEGRRAVFDMSSQRVWIVDADDTVERTYLVSGSVLDNLKPGTYEVFSRSRHANGIEDSGQMEYFVRFTRGANAAIGFHSIPVKDGEPLQTRAQLGTPQSHGCIRQARPDAIAMWEFAQIGTTVVVTA